MMFSISSITRSVGSICSTLSPFLTKQNLLNGFLAAGVIYTLSRFLTDRQESEELKFFTRRQASFQFDNREDQLNVPCPPFPDPSKVREIPFSSAPPAPLKKISPPCQITLFSHDKTQGDETRFVPKTNRDGVITEVAIPHFTMKVEHMKSARLGIKHYCNKVLSELHDMKIRSAVLPINLSTVIHDRLHYCHPISYKKTGQWMFAAISEYTTKYPKAFEKIELVRPVKVAPSL